MYVDTWVHLPTKYILKGGKDISTFRSVLITYIYIYIYLLYICGHLGKCTLKI